MRKDIDPRDMADNYDEYVENEMRNQLGPDDDGAPDWQEPNIDLTQYVEALRQAVEAENEKDKNWEWSVKSVDKTTAHIGWSYLDYCGGFNGKNTFTIESQTDDTLGDSLTARHPFGEMIDSIVVGGRFKDVATAEAGIKRIISAIASCAHSQY